MSETVVLNDDATLVEQVDVPRRSVAEILDVAEQQSTVMGVHRRLAANSINRTQTALWTLGLCDSAGRLLDDDELAERIAALRKVVGDA